MGGAGHAQRHHVPGRQAAAGPDVRRLGLSSPDLGQRAVGRVPPRQREPRADPRHQAAGGLSQASWAGHPDLPDQPGHWGHRAGEQRAQRLLRQWRVVLPRCQRQWSVRRLHVPRDQPAPWTGTAAAGHLPQGHDHRGDLDRQHQHNGGCRHRWIEQPPDISENGNTIAYSSDATNLVPGDTNGQQDCFVTPRANRPQRPPGQRRQHRAGPRRLELPLPAHRQRIDDGVLVLRRQRHRASLGQGQRIYVRNLRANSTTLVSRRPNGPPAKASRPDISGNGACVTYQSTDAGIVPGDPDTPTTCSCSTSPAGPRG